MKHKFHSSHLAFTLLTAAAQRPAARAARIDVKNIEVVCTGSTDDSCAFKPALDFLAVIGDATLRIPCRAIN